MNDKELIDLIEHYRWIVEPASGGGWDVMGFDWTWIVTAPTLREAVTKALSRQAGLEVLQNAAPKREAGD